MPHDTAPARTPPLITTDTGRAAIVWNWLLDAGLSSRAIHLYALLWSYADWNVSEAEVSRKALAAKLGSSLSSLDRAIKELVEAEAIEVTEQHDEHGDQRANRYHLHSTQPHLRGGSRTGDEGGLVTHDDPRSQILRTSESETSNEVSLSGGAANQTREIQEIYNHWRVARHRTSSRYDKISEKRRDKIRTRLREFTPDELKQAIDGVAHDPWEGRVNQDDLQIIFRSREQVEKFLDLAEQGPPRSFNPDNVTAADIAVALEQLPEEER